MKKAKSILVFSVIAAFMILMTVIHYESKKMLDFSENLEETAVTVDGVNITLAEMAFYVAYEENSVEEQAYIYSPDNTNAYWNLHIDGQFVKVAAKQAALDMAVHDVIFAALAVEENVTLSAADIASVENTESDFWQDLTGEQKQRLGVSEEQIYSTMEQLALAQKYQAKLSEDTGLDYETYSIAGSNYEKILEQHTVEVRKKIWSKIDFGNIVVQH